MKKLFIAASVLFCFVVPARYGLANANNIPSIDSGDNADLAEASAYVERMRLRAATLVESSLKSPVKLVGMPRFFREGDRWIVATSHSNPAFVRKTESKETLEVTLLDAIYFEFKVIKADDGTAVIEVQQIDSQGNQLTSGRVRKVLLVVDERLRVREKRYFYRGVSEAVIVRFSDGSVGFGFDIFPAELPDFERGEVSHVKKAPLLPTTLMKLMPEPRRTTREDETKYVRIEHEDGFARPVTVTWRMGDLWPSHVQSVRGHSVLIKQELQ